MINKNFVLNAFVYCLIVIIIYCNNQKVQTFVKIFISHTRSKYIDIQHHFVKNKIQNDTIELRYVINNNQIVNDLIKFLLKNKFLKFRHDIDFY